MQKTLISIILASISLTSVADNVKTKPSKENQAEIDRKIEIAKKKKKLEEDEAENERSRWIWRYNKDDNEVIWLHSYDRPTECKGNLLAIKTRWQMGNHEIIQNLCWLKNDREKFVTIIDTSAYFLGKTTIDASKLVYIPSDKEKREAKEAEDRRTLMNNLSDYISRKQREEQEQYRMLQQNLLRPPMLCNDMGGGMMMCN